MGKDRGREPKIRFFGRIRQSLRAQVSLIVLLSYLLPVLLLGVFTGSLLLHRLEEQTRTAVTSGAEQAWTLTEQNVERTLELARDATYDGELTDTWQKWNDGAIGDAEYMRLCRNYLERKYSREQLVSFAACFPVKNPEIFMYPRGGTAYSAAELQDLREAVLAEGETLDTRCRFICVGERMYLVRNLLSLRMERYGMLVLEIDSERLFGPVTELQRTWDARAEIRLDAYGDAEADWNASAPGLTDDGREELVYVRLSGGEENALDLRLTMDRREQYKEIYLFRQRLVIMCLLLIPILILIGIYLSKRIV